MKTASFALFLFSLLPSATMAVTGISRQECTDQGGSVVGDIGNGAIFEAGYVCESTNEPPTDAIVPAEGENIAVEGEVCCGGTGDGLSYAPSSDNVVNPDPANDVPIEDPSLATNNATNEEVVTGDNLDAVTSEACVALGGAVVSPDMSNSTTVTDVGNGTVAVEQALKTMDGSMATCDEGESMLAYVVPAEGEEPTGDVCCGAAMIVDETNSGGPSTSSAPYGGLLAVALVGLIL